MALPQLILDSNVLVSAFTSAAGASRQVLRRILSGDALALISMPLFCEYESVLTRPATQQRCTLSAAEQTQLFDALLAHTQWVEIYYQWRPNLRDEGDNHVLELAIAAGEAPIVTFNRRDFKGGELRFPGIAVQTPRAWLTAQGFR